MTKEDVIRFDNLRQGTTTVGGTVEVKTAKPFVSKNAQGDLRQVNDFKEIAALAKADGEDLLKLLKSRA